MTEFPVSRSTPTEAETRSWAMVANLSYFANFAVPLGGLICSILIYLLRRNESGFAREHFRNALNFEITIAIAYSFVFACYVSLVFWMYQMQRADPLGFMQYQSTVTTLVVTCIGALLVLIVGGAAAAGFAARAAWRGWPFRYPFVPSWVKTPR